MRKFTQETEVYKIQNPRMNDYYSLVYQLIDTMGFKSVLDVGCASGDFINLMNIADIKCVGVDISQELISQAKSNSNNSHSIFLNNNILENNLSIDNSFDCITCFGTAVAIENLGLLLETLISFKPKLIFLNDFVNVNGLDVVVGYRRQEQTKFNHPYNIRCEETWRELIKGFPDYSIEFEPYKMKTSLSKSDNPIRNYHSFIDGENLQRNGMDLILRSYNILIKSIHS